MSARSNEIDPGRLVVITGLPGSGKTNLATELARSMPAVRMCPDDWMMSYEPPTDEELATYDAPT